MCKKCTYWYDDKNVTAEVMKMGRRLSLHILLPTSEKLSTIIIVNITHKCYSKIKS